MKPPEPNPRHRSPPVRRRQDDPQDALSASRPRAQAKSRPSFYEHLHPPFIPAREARFRYTFGLGGIGLWLSLILLVTGVLELFYYVPSAEGANASVQTITHLVPYGGLVRALHYWAAQALVVTVLLHLLRVVLTGAYKPPRRFNWLLGIFLLASVVLLDFTGLGLRWDEEIAWALTVGTNLTRTIPVLGPGLYTLVVGGGELGSPTVVRFYGWHVLGLALLAGIVMVWHAFRVRRDGGISRASVPAEAAPAGDAPARISRRELVRREGIAALVVSMALLILSAWAPPRIAPPAVFSDLPADASAPWFFLWVQQLLRLGEPFWMGVAIPVGVLAVLAAIPYAIDRDRAGTGQWLNRQGRMAQVLVLLIISGITGLTIAGALR